MSVVICKFTIKERIIFEKRGVRMKEEREGEEEGWLRKLKMIKGEKERDEEGLKLRKREENV